MKNIFLILTLFTVLIVINNPERTYAYERKTDINLTQPSSFNGTYEIERFVIRQGDSVIVDSNDDYKVYDEKGIATIQLRSSNNKVFIDLVYKMQMVGPIFQNPEIGKYNFIYDKRTFTIDRPQGTPLSKTLTSIGMIVYDHEDLLWEFPFEKDLTLILKLEKKYNIATVIDKLPFLGK